MDRLTTYHGDVAVIKDKDLLPQAMARLAAYEETGLTPEEIMDGKLLTGWIPVEERLPDEPGTESETKEYNVTILGAVESTTLAYIGHDVWYDEWDNRYNVIAWMPLPEPYKPEN